MIPAQAVRAECSSFLGVLSLRWPEDEWAACIREWENFWAVQGPGEQRELSPGRSYGHTTLPLTWEGVRPVPSKCHLPHLQNGSRGDPFCLGCLESFVLYFSRADRHKGKLTLSSGLEVELQVFCKKCFS